MNRLQERCVDTSPRSFNFDEHDIEHWLNGVKVISISRGSGQWDTLVAQSRFPNKLRDGKSDAGYTALQDHSHTVWFRDILIR